MSKNVNTRVNHKVNQFDKMKWTVTTLWLSPVPVQGSSLASKHCSWVVVFKFCGKRNGEKLMKYYTFALADGLFSHAQFVGVLHPRGHKHGHFLVGRSALSLCRGSETCGKSPSDVSVQICTHRESIRFLSGFKYL